MKAIIPCCGYGTRVGMKPHESKELLPDHISGYKHLIDFAIGFCKRNNIEPFVITRKAKKDLIKYLKEKKIDYMLYEPKDGDEWAQTVLASKDHWHNENILILPDTRWNEYFIAKDIELMLKLGNDVVFGIHEVPDPQNWGIIENYTLFEKPKHFTGKEWAWGLIGFSNGFGEDIFLDKPYFLKNAGFIKLTGFKDVTRG